MEKLHVIKIGGNVIDDPLLLDKFLKDFAAIKSHKILIHGGGKLASSLANMLGIKQTIIEGRRVTDERTLDIAVMVYAGLVNKRIVAKLQSLYCKALGFCGADGNLIRATKRPKSTIDFGFVGDVLPDYVNAEQFEKILRETNVPIVSPVTHDGMGTLLNTNADSVAQVIALALKDRFDVKLTYCFEKNGVLQNINDEESFVPFLTEQLYNKLKASGNISKGMIPKLDNGFKALSMGLKQLSICHARSIAELEKDIIGTRLVLK